MLDRDDSGKVQPSDLFSFLKQVVGVGCMADAQVQALVDRVADLAVDRGFASSRDTVELTPQQLQDLGIIDIKEDLERRMSLVSLGSD